MKSIKTLTSVLLISAVALTACKKDENTSNVPDELSVTTDLSTKQAISDGMVEDDNSILFAASAEAGLDGARMANGGTSNSFLPCGSVTVSPGPSPNFKTITVDFGTGCTSPGGNITRRGKMIFVLSDSLRHQGATATLTFDNYYVNNFKREGTIVWTNNGHTMTTRSWTRTAIDGKITSPTGTWWIHNGTKTVVQYEGVHTIIQTDDAFRITGTGSTVNSNGVSRAHTIETPLIKRNGCDFIEAGTLRITGPAHYIVINYGNGGCDNQATLSVDGGTPYAITLN